MGLTSTEENYLKAIFKISEKDTKTASTTAIAAHLETTPASVTDMLKKLAEKELIHYEKYKGVSLTQEGNKRATNLVRKHRLWEVFLVEKLRFSWDQIHDIAEQLEHIQSKELVARLDAFLDYPKFDPHGDPIPNAQGKFTLRNQFQLADVHAGNEAILVGVRQQSPDFLQYLNDMGIKIGSRIRVASIVDYDRSMQITVNDNRPATISQDTSLNLIVKHA